MRTFKNLWPKMVSLENLMGAAREAMKGKRRKVAGAKFFGDWEKECVDLREELMEERYRPGPYKYFKIYEPKERRGAAAPFRDRVLHHAVVRVLEPVFEKRFLEDSFACRKGKGTHAGMRRALNYAGKHPIALKCEGGNFSRSCGTRLRAEVGSLGRGGISEAVSMKSTKPKLW